MNPLCLGHLNSVSPYKVKRDEASGLYYFITKNQVQLTIDFMDDDLITTAESYQFVINNANNQKSPRDIKVQQTILLIVDEFFRQNQAAFLYLCETSDGKQKARSRLFSYWFETYAYTKLFTCMTTSLLDLEGVYNSATLIIRNDHPNYRDVIADFTNISAVLSEKPISPAL